MTVKLRVKIVPRAAASELVGWHGDRLRIRIAAVPEGGRANEALIRFVAAALGLARSHVRIASGHTSSLKTLEIDAIDAATLAGRLPPRS